MSSSVMTEVGRVLTLCLSWPLVLSALLVNECWHPQYCGSKVVGHVAVIGAVYLPLVIWRFVVLRRAIVAARLDQLR